MLKQDLYKKHFESSEVVKLIFSIQKDIKDGCMLKDINRFKYKDEKGVYLILEKSKETKNNEIIYCPIYIGKTNRSFKERIQQYLKVRNSGNTLLKKLIYGRNLKPSEAIKHIETKLEFKYLPLEDKNSIIKFEHLLIGLYNPELND